MRIVLFISFVAVLVCTRASAQVVGLAHGGTNQTTWTASKCVHVNAGGTGLESMSGDCVTTASTIVTSITGDGVLITNSGSTGAVTLILGNAGAHKFWGNNTGSTATPGFEQLACADLSNSSGGCSMSTTAGGDLSGTLPNPTVAKVNGNTPGGTCVNQVTTAIDTSARPSCTTITSAYTSGTFTATAHNLLSGTHADTVAASPVLGDIPYGNATPAWTKLAGNTTTTKEVLSETGTGTVSAVPVWLQLACEDLSNAAPSCSTDTTNAANISSGTLPAGRLPNPSASTLGGIESIAATSHEWIDSISTAGVPHESQPACADLSNAAASCSTDATNATNISSGTLSNNRLTGSGAVTINTTSPLAGGGSVSLGGTQTQSCPTCLVGPNTTTVGGIMGGYYGSASVTGTLGPWSSSGSASKTVLPFAASLRNLAISTTGTSSSQGQGILNFQSRMQSTSSEPYGARLVIKQGSVAGVYQEATNYLPFRVGAGYDTSIQYQGLGNVNAVTIRGYSWDIIGTTSQPLGWASGTAATVAGSTTQYIGPGINGPAGGFLNTESQVGAVIPYAATAQGLCVWTNAAQSSNNSLVVTLRRNGTTSTSLAVTIAASAGTGQYCDYSDTVEITAGDWIAWKITNNANVTSASILSIGMELASPTAPATGMIVFPLGNLTIASGSAIYFPPFTGVASSGTEANQRAPMPRAVTMKNLACLATTLPGTSADVVTVVQNGSTSGLTVSIPTSGSTPNIQTDSTHTVSYSQFDTFSIQFNQTSGANPSVSSCSVQVN